MADLGLLQIAQLACAVAGAGIVIWGLLVGRIRPRGYRGAAVLLALVFTFYVVARGAFGSQDSTVELFVAMGIVFMWGRFTVPKSRDRKLAPPPTAL